MPGLTCWLPPPIAGWGKSDAIRCRKVLDCFYLVGRKRCGQRTPPLAPRVNIAAAKQADLVLDFVHRNRHLGRYGAKE